MKNMNLDLSREFKGKNILITGGTGSIGMGLAKQLVKYDPKEIRIFSNDEIIRSKKAFNKTAFFSKRFAAKEAFSKALGTGFRKGLNFNDISIINDKYGKPSIKLNNKLQSIIKKKFKTKKINVYLSISDEKKHSIAFVILEKK